MNLRPINFEMRYRVYNLNAMILDTSLAVNRFPVELKTSSASSSESSVSNVAICCNLEKDSRIDPEAKEDCEQR